MLGKRARSIHRTASICELNAPAAAGSHRIEPPPAVMQQVIGFNPTTGRKDANPINAAVVDSPNNYQSSSGGDRPRSALQSLLAAATRQRQNNGGNPTATMNYNHEQNMSIKGGGSNSSSPKEAFLLHHSRRRNEPPSPVATGARRINGHGNSISPFLFQLPSSSPLDTILHGTPQANLLKSCCFCKRLLGPGRDIYMYRGDKAFCSVECRYEQIMLDERKNGFILNSPSSRVTQRSSHHPSILNIGNVGAS